MAVTETQAALGIVPPEAAAEIRARARVDADRISALEEETRHDVLAFIASVEEQVGPSARFFHYGLTSSDVLDTALALRLVRALDLILAGLDDLMAELKTLAWKHKKTLIMGRSHGIHAEPTTFGLKLALFYSEFGRRRDNLLAARQVVAVGKCSGPVGNFSAPGLSLEVEERALARLGLTPAPVSNQVIQRDRHGQYFCALSLLASSMEKLAVEIRHLARTEVGEVEEPFAQGQKGSSAMPHKKNPIGAENISGLARVVRGHTLAALEDVALWHERDISHSSVERIIAPDSTSLVDYMLVRLKNLVAGLVVHPERMARNMALTGGLYNSQEILLLLCARGIPRAAAYEMVQSKALRSHRDDLDFKTLLLADPEVIGRITLEEIEAVFQPDRFLAAVDAIFERVFIDSEQSLRP